MYKYWQATKDTRTRDTHRHLDGAKKRIDEPFKSSGCIGQAPKLFVGVNSAKKTSTVVVSLCITLTKMICLVQQEYVKDDGTTEVIPQMTYREWEKYKRKRK